MSTNIKITVLQDQGLKPLSYSHKQQTKTFLTSIEYSEHNMKYFLFHSVEYFVVVSSTAFVHTSVNEHCTLFFGNICQEIESANRLKDGYHPKNPQSAIATGVKFRLLN